MAGKLLRRRRRSGILRRVQSIRRQLLRRRSNRPQTDVHLQDQSEHLETQNQLTKNLLANTDFISLNATENVPKNNTLENLNILKVERIENSKIETPSNIIFRHTLPTDSSKAIDSSSALELSQNRNWGTFGGPLKRNTVFENPKHFWKCRLSSLNALDLEVEEG